MANNNITHTPNYNLATIAKDQDELTFGEFRDVLFGTNNSNMQKIDEKVNNINARTNETDDLQRNIDETIENVVNIKRNVEKLEQKGVVTVDYSKLSNILIAKTDPAPAVMIAPNPNDTTLRGLTIYGNTTQAGTPTPDNPIPIVGAVNPTVQILNNYNLLDTDRYYKFLVDNDTAPASPTTRGNDGQYDYISIHGHGVSGLKYMENEFMPNTQYTISFKAKHQGNPINATTGFKLVYTDGVATYVNVPISALDWTKFVQTSVPNKTLSYLQISYNSGGYVDFSELMLVKGVYNTNNIPNFLPYSGQSVTLNDITLHGYGDVRDTVTVKDGKVLFARNWQLLTDLNRFISLFSGMTATYASLYTPSDTVPVGSSTAYCNLLPNVYTPATGYVSAQITPSRLYIYDVPNALTGIDGELPNDTKRDLMKAWLIDKNIEFLYCMGEPIIEDITDTPDGQALLAACEVGGTTISVSGGATVEVVYNRDIVDAIDDIYAILGNLLGG